MKTFLGIGSNLGDRAAWLRRGIAGLEGAGLGPCRVSSVWQTAALDAPDGVESPDFYNLVVCCETDLGPRPVLERLLDIERRSGRERQARNAPPNAPRTLDLDLLCITADGIHLDETVVDEPGLVVPHPRMWLRRFVLEPLAELAPGLTNPASGNSIEVECTQLRRTQDARRLGPFAGL